MSGDIFNGRRGPEEDETFRRLRDRYGYDRALQIIDGNDDATNRDIAAWKALGGLTDTTRAAG